MSDGDDETPTEDESEASDADESTEITEESLEERLQAAEESLEAAETEADLDEVEATLDEVEADLEAADLPEPEDEEEEDPREALESTLSDLRDDLEDARGPYAEDVVADVEAAQTTLEEGEWTEQGEEEIVDVVEAFTASVGETLDGDFSPSGSDVDALVGALDSVVDAVEAATLDADEDSEVIAELLEATDELESGLDDAQEWDDLEVNEKLMAEGFYDVIGHYKDYPPELSALKEHEQRGNVEMILMALDVLGSDYMEEHCMEMLTRMNDLRAFDAMHQKAQRRDKTAVKALGKMGAEDAVETLLEYVDADSDPALQKVTFKALGEIGSEEATQALVDKLVMDNDNVRPYAARALGLLGDTRAVDPLVDTLETDESDTVRAAAAWALRQIGTEAALEAAAEHTGDRAYIVQQEAERAAETLGATQTA